MNLDVSENPPSGAEQATRPLVSIIIPCRNERNYIAKLLDSILANDYPRDQLEIFVVDGMSDDGTQDIVRSYAALYPFISLLENPGKTAPAALNVGIARAAGDIVMRMDAHAEYPVNYISGLASALMESGADNVGGVCRTRPGDNTAIAKAISLALAHPFGVGDSYFRIDMLSKPRWVDTVPFGCFRRTIFERVGVFDEELVRNQDDEFNLRIIKNGGKILLLPQIHSIYYARSSLEKLWLMYYQYGYFKPLVIKKIGGLFTLRQLVPATFVMSLVGFSILSFWFEWARYALAAVAVAYLGLNLAFSAVAAWRTEPVLVFPLSLAFMLIHIGYGIGFLKGVWDFLLTGQRRRAQGANVISSR